MKMNKSIQEKKTYDQLTKIEMYDGMIALFKQVGIHNKYDIPAFIQEVERLKATVLKRQKAQREYRISKHAEYGPIEARLLEILDYEPTQLKDIVKLYGDEDITAQKLVYRLTELRRQGKVIQSVTKDENGRTSSAYRLR